MSTEANQLNTGNVSKPLPSISQGRIVRYKLSSVDAKRINDVPHTAAHPAEAGQVLPAIIVKHHGGEHGDDAPTEPTTAVTLQVLTDGDYVLYVPTAFHRPDDHWPHGSFAWPPSQFTYATSRTD